MTNHQPILVGVNGSRASSAAIRFGVHEANRLGAPLWLVHVVAEFVPMPATSTGAVRPQGNRSRDPGRGGR